MAAPTTTQASIDVVHSFSADVWNDRTYERIDDLVTEDVVQHGPVTGMELNGSDELMANIRQYHEAFSDLESTVNLVFCDDSGEYVCAHFTNTGTHDGELMGIPATNVEGMVNVIGIYRIEDDRIAESWILGDMYGLFSQLDTFPESGPLAS